MYIYIYVTIAAEAAVAVDGADADVGDCVRVPRRVVICFQVAQHRSCRRRPTNIYIYIYTYVCIQICAPAGGYSSSLIIKHDSS